MLRPLRIAHGCRGGKAGLPYGNFTGGRIAPAGHAGPGPLSLNQGPPPEIPAEKGTGGKIVAGPVAFPVKLTIINPVTLNVTGALIST